MDPNEEILKTLRKLNGNVVGFSIIFTIFAILWFFKNYLS